MVNVQRNYEVVRRLEDGQILLIAIHAELDAAEKLIRSLNAEWPGDYSIRDKSKSVLPNA
jgi:hypothetical protein